MFNTYNFNSWYFDKIVPTAVAEVVSWEVVYNGKVLHKTDNLCLTFFGGVNWPVIELNNYTLPNTSWLGNNSSFSRDNTFSVSWYLTADTWEELVNQKDILKSTLSEQNQYLQVNFWGNIRRARAYVTGLESIFNEQHYNITFVPFQITFTILEGYWEDVALTSELFSGITTSFTEELINNSTFNECRPTINIVFNSTSSTTNLTFETGDFSISIDNTFNDNDILIIDSFNRDVTLNGSSIDFDGVFPILSKGNNSFNITSNGTYELTAAVSFRKTFI